VDILRYDVDTRGSVATLAGTFRVSLFVLVRLHLLN
jgi:hypothetical protein